LVPDSALRRLLQPLLRKALLLNQVQVYNEFCFIECIVKGRHSDRNWRGRSSLARKEVNDEKIKAALRGIDLKTELMPLSSKTGKIAMVVCYLFFGVIIYVMYKLFPSNRFRVQKLVSKLQGHDASK
jgi:hypothetical protein